MVVNSASGRITLIRIRWAHHTLPGTYFPIGGLRYTPRVAKFKKKRKTRKLRNIYLKMYIYLVLVININRKNCCKN